MTRERKQKPTGSQEIRVKLQHFCAYQERSHQDVKDKLSELGVYGPPADAIISSLITDGFLNEERFAKAFAGGKFRMQKWGRNKIIYALESHGLTANCINLGLKEIDERDYRKTLLGIIRKKITQSGENNPFKKRSLISRYAISRGFEPDLVWEIVKEELST